MFLTADPMGVRAALVRVVDRLAPVIGRAPAGTVELVLAEALNNIVEHAYDGAGGPIEIWLDRQAGTIRCSIRDKGRPMPPGGPPVAAAPDCITLATLPEGGFGWLLIRQLTSELAYDREGGANRLRFRVPVE